MIAIRQGFATPEGFTAPVDTGAEGLPMFKNITRQLFARLNRHLPHRLVHRDPLPNRPDRCQHAYSAFSE